jgi:hypothetical protein
LGRLLLRSLQRRLQLSHLPLVVGKRPMQRERLHFVTGSLSSI